MMERVFAYIAHRHRSAYLAAGWEVTPLRLPHGVYSALAEWVGDGDPIFPALPARDLAEGRR